MTVEFQDSKEKERVREELWKPIFEKVFEKVKNIKYLTLPGPNCHDIEKFLKLGLLKIQNTVSVEKEKDCADKIKTFYAKEVGLGIDKIPNSIYHDNIENLIKNRDFVSLWFPFNIINLDLYGSPFNINRDDESKLFNFFDDIIKKQKISEKECHIFITVKLNTPNKIGTNNISTVKLIRSLILVPLSKSLDNNTLKDRINKEYKDKNEWMKIYAIILNMIHQSERNTNISLLLKPYTYIGKGRTTRMIAYVVKVTFSNERPLNVAYHGTKRNKLLSEAIDLIEKTVWIN